MLNQYVNRANPDAHVQTTGPEIWRQTEGQVTHFVAGLGTCGTITGNGRFLKERNPQVQVIGVHPEEGHDIPGVRSLKQLQLTELFVPDEYDALVRVDNREAYEMCLRLNREESIVAGPSSAMALVGALKVIEDEPGAVVVVIFPDNAFKYASSLERHYPELQGAASAGAPSETEQLLAGLIENSRNTYNTCEAIHLKTALGTGGEAWVIDVRGSEVYGRQHLAGAINIPLGELVQRQAELPRERDTPIFTVCNKGNMSIKGMLVLQSLGYRNVKSLNGGTEGWAAKNLPTSACSP